MGLEVGGEGKAEKKEEMQHVPEIVLLLPKNPSGPVYSCTIKGFKHFNITSYNSSDISNDTMTKVLIRLPPPPKKQGSLPLILSSSQEVDQLVALQNAALQGAENIYSE